MQVFSRDFRALCLFFNSSSAYCVTGETVETTTDQKIRLLLEGTKYIFLQRKEKKCNFFIYLMNPDNSKIIKKK